MGNRTAYIYSNKETRKKEKEGAERESLVQYSNKTFPDLENIHFFGE